MTTTRETRDLPAGTARALTRLRTDLQEIFASRLESLVLYGGHADAVASSTATQATAPTPSPAPAGAAPAAQFHTLALVTSLAYADLAACASRVQGWTRAGLATPLLLVSDEFAASLDAFPLEYGAIIAHHHVVHGSDPFTGIAVNAEDVRRACEVQAKSHLLHLREGFLETHGQGDAVGRLIRGSIDSFTTLLINLASLDRAEVSSPDALARYAESRIGLSASLLARLFALPSRSTLGADEAAQLYPPYLDASDTLARFVDRWKERGPA
jgi:hypothetical protein